MKVRIKFTKEGPMKFVGHLDTMRYFQKAVRRAELPIAFSGGYSPHMIMSFAAPLGWQNKIEEFMKQPEILVTKETKKGEKEVDIRPFIYKMALQENDRIFLSLASASANYTKPDAVIAAFAKWLGWELPEFACMIHRLEVYADLGDEKKHNFVSLESLGEEIK